MDTEVIVLRDQVEVLRRRWRVIAACLVLCLVPAAVAVYLQPPMYRASAELLLAPTHTNQVRADGELLAPEEISTQVAVVTSSTVARAVRNRLGLPDTPAELLTTISVEQVEDMRVLAITAERPTARGAAAVANGFATAYLTQRESQAARAARAAMDSLQRRYDSTQTQLAEVQEALASADDAQQAALQSRERALSVQLTQVLEQLSAAESTTETMTDGGQILVPAVTPAAPAEPQVIRSLVLAALVGLLLGVGLALVRDHFDDAIRDEERLRRVLRDKPVLGRIPHWTKSSTGRLVTLLDPHNPVSEAYRSLSSSVRFLTAATEEPGRGSLLLVSSAVPGEGKTTVASNLAVVASRFGLRVILVDADMRKPSVSRMFGLGDPPGLSDLVVNREDPTDYLIDVGEPDLLVLGAGRVPPNPAELLASPGAMRVLDDLRTRADLVIVDTPPVTRVSDAGELVPSADLVLMVARRAVTHGKDLVAAVERITQVGGSVSGAVLNDYETDVGRYEYGSATPPRSTASGADRGAIGLAAIPGATPGEPGSSTDARTSGEGRGAPQTQGALSRGAS